MHYQAHDKWKENGNDVCCQHITYQTRSSISQDEGE